LLSKHYNSVFETNGSEETMEFRQFVQEWKTGHLYEHGKRIAFYKNWKET